MRNYDFIVEVCNHNKDMWDDIVDAIDEYATPIEYSVDEWKTQMKATFSAGLDGGMDEWSYAEGLAKEITLANGRPCTIRIHMLCTDDLPWEVYDF